MDYMGMDPAFVWYSFSFFIFLIIVFSSAMVYCKHRTEKGLARYLIVYPIFLTIAAGWCYLQAGIPVFVSSDSLTLFCAGFFFIGGFIVFMVIYNQMKKDLGPRIDIKIKSNTQRDNKGRFKKQNKMTADEIASIDTID